MRTFRLKVTSKPFSKKQTQAELEHHTEVNSSVQGLPGFPTGQGAQTRAGVPEAV